MDERAAVHRAYKFRLYPTSAQLAELAEMERQLRWIYNLAHEQRLMALARPRDERPPRVDYFRQAREMTEIVRAPGGDQLARVVCCARQEVLRDLDRAWQRFWKRLGGRPRFKNKRDAVRIYFSPKQWRLHLGKLLFAGAASSLGELEMRQDRPWPGDSKFSSCHLVRDVDQWYAVFPLEYSLEVKKAPSGTVGINRGAVHAIADSQGRVVDSPRYYEQALDRIRLLSRRLARKEKGSRNRHKAALKLARAHRRVRRQREHFLHEQSAYYVSHYTTIGIEDMSVKKIVGGEAAEEPHHFSVTCKRAGCERPVFRLRLCKECHDEQRFIPKRLVRRSILDVGWYELGRQLDYKSEPAGGRVVRVNPGLEPTTSFVDGTAGEAGISTACSGCGATIPYASGRQEAFCTKCIYTAPGDVNAARNVLLRVIHSKPPASGKALPPKKAKVSIKIKGRAKAQPENTAKPAVEAYGGEAPVRAPVEVGTPVREDRHPDRTVDPER